MVWARFGTHQEVQGGLTWFSLESRTAGGTDERVPRREDRCPEVQHGRGVREGWREERHQPFAIRPKEQIEAPSEGNRGSSRLDCQAQISPEEGTAHDSDLPSSAAAFDVEASAAPEEIELWRGSGQSDLDEGNMGYKYLSFPSAKRVRACLNVPCSVSVPPSGNIKEFSSPGRHRWTGPAGRGAGGWPGESGARLFVSSSSNLGRSNVTVVLGVWAERRGFGIDALANPLTLEPKLRKIDHYEVVFDEQPETVGF